MLLLFGKYFVHKIFIGINLNVKFQHVFFTVWPQKAATYREGLVKSRLFPKICHEV